MTSRLPLYLAGKPLAEGGSAAAIDVAPRLPRDEGCFRCSLREGARSCCLPPIETAPGTGGALFVAERPSREEDRVGALGHGAAFDLLKRVLPLGAGRSVITSAVRCAPGSAEVSEKHLDACRGYLAWVVDDELPDRIVCLGAAAAEAVLGRRVSPLSARKSFARTAKGIPVFVVLSPAQAAGNRHLQLALQEDLAWALSVKVPAGPEAATFSLVETEADAQEAALDLADASIFAYDCEWIGRPYGREGFHLTNIACAPCDRDGPEHVWVWPLESLQDGRAEPLKRLMRSGRVLKVGANLPVDVHAVERGLGVPVRGQHADVRLQRKLLEADADGDIATMAELVGMGGHKEEADAEVERIGKAVKKELRARAKMYAVGTLLNQHISDYCLPRLFPHVPERVEVLAFTLAAQSGTEVRAYALGLLPRELGARYNARDALATARLYCWCSERLAREENAGPARIWDRVVRHALPAVQRVEAWGVPIDRSAVDLVRAHLTGKLAEVDARLAAYVEPGFNWSSTIQVAALFYEKLKIPCPQLTDSGRPATDEETLARISDRHPAIKDLLERRRIEKMLGTYVEGLERAIGIDGRAHGYILLDGAGSGRTSMASPNLQNVPGAKSEDGEMIRRCIAAPAGCALLELDYSRLEPCIAALLSGDPALTQVFVEGRDFHGETAQIVQPYLWPKAPIRPDGKAEITKAQRDEAKPVGLAALYGKGAKAMAVTLGTSVQVAQAALDAILGRYRVLGAWIKQRLAFARTHGYAETWWEGRPGRRRPLWDIGSPDEARRGTPERSSYNTPIQGTGSDFLLRSLGEVVRLIEEEGLPAKLILPVHDSLLLECKIADVSEVAATVKAVMLSWDSGEVPLDADVKAGLTWASMIPLDKWLAASAHKRATQ
jgi:uracil-DNA glycosylase family 4